MAWSEEENVYGLFNFDDGLLLEEFQDAEMLNFLVDFDDSTSENGSEGMVDLLPNDPFGMEFFNPNLPRDPFGMDFDIEATVAAISGLMDDFGLNNYGFETDKSEENNNSDDSSLRSAEDDGNDDNTYFTELNFVWTSSMDYEEENEGVDAGSSMHLKEGSYDEQSMLCGGMDDLMSFGCEKYEIEHVNDGCDANGEAGVDMITFVLQYLDLVDLLSVERVCRSLRDAVKRKPYLWKSIHIDYPLSKKFTDENLLQLSDRAQGELRSLSLVKCFNITKDGLEQVLLRNLKLSKLCVAGSVKLQGEGLLENLKLFNSVARPGIKHLRVGDPTGLSSHHLKELNHLLGAKEAPPVSYKPRFYRAKEIRLPLDDERAIDIEVCPSCQLVGQVYDCPTENCQVKRHSSKTCRACICCISRCVRCGCCLDGRAFEETFCFDFLCFDCVGELLIQEGVMLPNGQGYFQQTRYHVYIYS